jgi:hypothetical protein
MKIAILLLLFLIVGSDSFAQDDYQVEIGKTYWVLQEYPFYYTPGHTVAMEDVLLQKIKILSVEKTGKGDFPIRYTILLKKDTVYADGAEEPVLTRRKTKLVRPFPEYLEDYDYARKHWDKKTIACYLRVIIYGDEPCEGMSADALWGIELGYYTDKFDDVEKWSHGGIYTMTRLFKEYTIVVKNDRVKSVTWHDVD